MDQSLNQKSPRTHTTIEFRSGHVFWVTGILLFSLFLNSCSILDLGEPLEGTPLASPLPPTLAQVASDPTPTESLTQTPSMDPNVFVFQDGMVKIVDWSGEVLNSWAADGLNPEETLWYQVVGDSLYYLHEETGKIFLTRPGSVVSLEFPGEEAIQGFVISEDGSRIAWSIHGTGRNELWIANTNGLGRIRVVDEPPDGVSMNEVVLEPAGWINNSDVVYSWQYLAMGQEVWPDVYGSFYVYSPAAGQITTAAALPEEPASPCWRGMTLDGAFLAGICGSDSQIEQLKVVDVNSDVEELIPVLPEQSYVGAVVFSDPQRQIAYAVADSVLEDRTSRVVLRSFPGDVPAVLMTLEGELARSISWIDESRMLVEVETRTDFYVSALSVQGEQRVLAEGRLLGWSFPAEGE